MNLIKQKLERFHRIQLQAKQYFFTKFGANKHNYKYTRRWNLHKQYLLKICIDSKLFRVQILIIIIITTTSSSLIITKFNYQFICSAIGEIREVFLLPYTYYFPVYLILIYFFQTENHRTIRLFVDIKYTVHVD